MHLSNGKTIIIFLLVFYISLLIVEIGPLWINFMIKCIH